MAEPVDFYFDFTSPYAYFASLHVDEIGQRHDCDVVWKPVCYPQTSKSVVPSANDDTITDDLFVNDGASKDWTTQYWARARALQAEYVLMDTARVARLHRIELNCAFPLATSETADRAYMWLYDQSPRVARNFAQAVFHAHWRLGQNIEDHGLLGDCGAAAGQDPDAVKVCLSDAATLTRIQSHRKDVEATGVFAAPSLRVAGQLFWGWDRMAMAEAWLEHGGW